MTKRNETEHYIASSWYTPGVLLLLQTLSAFKRWDGKLQATKRHNRVLNSSFGRGKWQAAMRHTMGTDGMWQAAMWHTLGTDGM